MILPPPVIWHWHFARLLVMLVVEIWALRRTEHWIFPLITTSVLFSLETLFQVNEPGAFSYGNWIFSLALFLVAWLTAKSFWGTLAAFLGSILLNQALVCFAYEGIVSYMDLPDSFLWNFGVALFVSWAGLSLVWKTFADKARQKLTAEQLLSVKDIGLQEQKEEHEL